jgi:hypothetical protein
MNGDHQHRKPRADERRKLGCETVHVALEPRRNIVDRCEQESLRRVGHAFTSALARAALKLNKSSLDVRPPESNSGAVPLGAMR